MGWLQTKHSASWGREDREAVPMEVKNSALCSPEKKSDNIRSPARQGTLRISFPGGQCFAAPKADVWTSVADGIRRVHEFKC